MKLTVAMEGGSGRSRGTAEVFDIEGCSTPGSRASADSGGDAAGPPTTPSAPVEAEAAEGVPDAAARGQIAPASFDPVDMPLPDVGPDWSMVVQETSTRKAHGAGAPPELESRPVGRGTPPSSPGGVGRASGHPPRHRRGDSDRGCRGHARPPNIPGRCDLSMP